MAAVEHDHNFAGRNSAQRIGELGVGDGGLGERLVGGTQGVHRQQVLARRRPGLQAAAVARDVEEDCGIWVAAPGYVSQRLADGRLGRFAVNQ